MKLIVKDKEYSIAGFNYSVNFGTADEREDLDVEVGSDANILTIASEINSVFDGIVTITTDRKSYTFTDLELQQVNTFADESNERTSIRFIKAAERE